MVIDKHICLLVDIQRETILPGIRSCTNVLNQLSTVNDSGKIQFTSICTRSRNVNYSGNLARQCKSIPIINVFFHIHQRDE